MNNMRTRLFTALFVLVSATFWQCSKPVRKSTVPRDILTPLRSSIEDILKSPNPGFNKNQLLFFPTGPISTSDINEIKNSMARAGIDASRITIRTCNSCSGDVQLWEAPDIYTYAVSEGVRSGSGGGGSNGVGEDRFGRYSFNWNMRIDTVEMTPGAVANYNKSSFPVLNLAGKSVVRIAVLDTGVDTVRYIHNSYLWKNSNETPNNRDDDRNCYADDISGWNFLNNTSDFADNHTDIHGSLVTKYIIDQFGRSRTNAVQIMALKTHDNRGYGNLFATICALNYAIDNNANIINASWGYYDYGVNPVPYLDSLITQVMPRKGIIFVTAAGNKVEADDAYARSVYRAMHGGAAISEEGLRNLQIHSFYPAILSTASNNVIVATTSDETRVSPTQNYSSQYVDLGVMADEITPATMKFTVPFIIPGTTLPPISGSSFATAIAAGKIGANFKTTLYRPGITKSQVLNDIDRVIRRSSSLKNNQWVRDGRYIERR